MKLRASACAIKPVPSCVEVGNEFHIRSSPAAAQEQPGSSPGAAQEQPSSSPRAAAAQEQPSSSEIVRLSIYIERETS